MKKDLPLFEGIMESAQKEAASIRAEGDKEIESLRRLHEKKLAKALEAEERLIEKKKQEISLAMEHALRNLERNHNIETTKKLRKLAEDALNRKMGEMIDSQEYQRALILWIAEAAIAVDSPEAKVASSKRENITPEMLFEAQKIIEKITGRKMKLSLNPEPLSSQGVVVSTLSDSVAYNNQVRTRLKRCTSDFERLLEGSKCQKK
ncbi:MAG: V-type ATP synthase subunit E family protein [Sphaerochaetaceae bacterium]|nr:V-type ATP synthase subunit E family protein [Sphaerochaetaceae bacterium]